MEKSSLRIFWMPLEFGADAQRIQAREIKFSHSDGEMHAATWEASGERVARRSQIDRASKAASCHSRFLSARSAEARIEGNSTMRRFVLKRK